MTQTLNQFVQAPVKGMMDLLLNLHSLDCVVDSGSTTLVPGQPVKRVDGYGVIAVTACTSDDDLVFGFVAYDPIHSSYAAGKAVPIAQGMGDVIYLEAGAAFAAMTKLMIVVAGSKVITATSGKPIVGYAVDKSSGTGAIVRVSLACPAFWVV